jgi:hypothetical protein
MSAGTICGFSLGKQLFRGGELDNYRAIGYKEDDNYVLFYKHYRICS